MKSSLIPEKPILVYPSLAATVGLEEAVLLTVFSDLSQHNEAQWNNGYAWQSLGCEQITEALPFFNAQDIQRICQSLRDKGILLVGPALFGQEESFRFAFNEKSQQAENKIPAPVQHAPQRTVPHKAEAVFNQPSATTDNVAIFGKNYISPGWQPDQDTLSQLHFHSIPTSFAMQEVPEFVTYWRERKETRRSWGSVFINRVLHQWRKFEAKAKQRSEEIYMHRNWLPSEDAMHVLIQQSGVSQSFIEDAIPEFLLYWQERGDKLSTWNAKFIQHVKLQWYKYQNSLESSAQPLPIPANWQPSEEVKDVLRLANIDLQFAQGLIAEFVLYWRDSGQIHTSWNTRFLQYVKKRWASRHELNQASQNDNNRSTREISLEEELGDRSWAQ